MILNEDQTQQNRLSQSSRLSIKLKRNPDKLSGDTGKNPDDDRDKVRPRQVVVHRNNLSREERPTN